MRGSDMVRKARKTLSDLLAVMAGLRTPGSGCPWDLAQTFQSIAPYTIEEAYEVAEAIAGGDRGEMLEELGDLLLQVVYHARMAEEEGAFNFEDVVDRITRKMLRRHPHVFGTAAERAAGAPPGFWERIKDAEKAERAHAVRAPAAGRRATADEPSGAAPANQSILDGIGKALPALTRAVKLQHKAASVGFDWPNLAPVLSKLTEELGEFQKAIAAARDIGHLRAAPEVAEEFGDLLFVMANVARHLHIDPEASLRAANAKFIRRFRRIEERLAAEGRSPQQATLAEMDRIWEEAKAEERAGAPAAHRPAPAASPSGRSSRSPVQSPVQSPVRSPVRSPVQSPVRSPAQSRTQSPAPPSPPPVRGRRQQHPKLQAISRASSRAAGSAAADDARRDQPNAGEPPSKSGNGRAAGAAETTLGRSGGRSGGRSAGRPRVRK